MKPSTVALHSVGSGFLLNLIGYNLVRIQKIWPPQDRGVCKKQKMKR